MIKRKSDMNSELKVNMRGGDGQVLVTKLLEKGEYKGSARLAATLTLEKGCSIGEHLHENEEEIFLVISGTAEYNDNGEAVTIYPGDCCICTGGQKHSIRNNNDEALVVGAFILQY